MTPLPDRQRRQRRIRRYTVAAFLLAGVGCVALYAHFIAGDIPPPEDSDLLLPPRVEIPDEENGFARLIAIVEGMSDFDDAWLDEFSGHPLFDADPWSLDLSKSSAWIGSPVRVKALAMLEQTQDAFEAIDRALAFQKWQYPKSDESQSFTSLNRLSNHSMQLRVDVLILEERTSEALEEGLRLAEIGRRSRRSADGIGDVMMRASLELTGLKSMRELCRIQLLSAPDLIRALSRIPTAEMVRHDLERAAKFDYMESQQWILADPPSFTYKPHRTLATLADGTRQFIDDLHRPFLDRAQAPSNGLMEQGAAVLTGNAVGNTLTGIVASNREMLLAFAADLAWQIEATRLLLATEIHRLRHGALPPTLDALVPAILASVPLDPYNGNPLGYDPGRGVIWSVGEDGVNSGGLAESDSLDFDANEPTLWLPPPTN